MTSALLIAVSEWSLFVAAFVGLLVICGATVYDLIEINRRHQQVTIRQSRLPHVTVLVYAMENQAALEQCLESVGQSQYPHCDIVVVDNASNIVARHAMKIYQQQHAQTIYVYRKQKATDRLTALRQGYKKSQRGEVVLVIDGTSLLEPLTLREGAVSFVVNPSLRALQLHTHMSGNPSIALLIQHSLRISQQLLHKCLALFWTAHVHVSDVSVFYRRVDFLQHVADVSLPSVYAGRQVIPMQKDIWMAFRSLAILPQFGDSVWIMLRRSLGYISVVFGLALVTYFFYTAASLASSSLLMLSWAGVSVWFAVAVWSDESATWSEKMVTSFCLPMLYLLIYAYGLIATIVVILKTVIQLVHVMKRRFFLSYQAVKYVSKV